VRAVALARRPHDRQDPDRRHRHRAAPGARARLVPAIGDFVSTAILRNLELLHWVVADGLRRRAGFRLPGESLKESLQRDRDAPEPWFVRFLSTARLAFPGFSAGRSASSLALRQAGARLRGEIALMESNRAVSVGFSVSTAALLGDAGPQPALPADHHRRLAASAAQIEKDEEERLLRLRGLVQPAETSWRGHVAATLRPVQPETSRKAAPPVRQRLVQLELRLSSRDVSDCRAAFAAGPRQDAIDRSCRACPLPACAQVVDALRGPDAFRDLRHPREDLLQLLATARASRRSVARQLAGQVSTRSPHPGEPAERQGLAPSSPPGARARRALAS